MTIVEFLEARLAEDEAIALKSGGSEAEWLYRTEYDNETGNEVVWANSRTEEWLGPAQKEPYVSYGRYVTMDHEGCLPAVGEDDGPHIARHDPARILREVAAKRELVACEGSGRCQGHPKPWMRHGEHGAGFCFTPPEGSVLYVLAAIYSDHPDFNEEWRP